MKITVSEFIYTLKEKSSKTLARKRCSPGISKFGGMFSLNYTREKITPFHEIGYYLTFYYVYIAQSSFLGIETKKAYSRTLKNSFETPRQIQNRWRTGCHHTQRRWFIFLLKLMTAETSAARASAKCSAVASNITDRHLPSVLMSCTMYISLKFRLLARLRLVLGLSLYTCIQNAKKTKSIYGRKAK